MNPLMLFDAENTHTTSLYSRHCNLEAMLFGGLSPCEKLHQFSAQKCWVTLWLFFRARVQGLGWRKLWEESWYRIFCTTKPIGVEAESGCDETECLSCTSNWSHQTEWFEEECALWCSKFELKKEKYSQVAIALIYKCGIIIQKH